MLQAHPEIDTLFACNDMMALGAMEAIAAAGKTGKIRVIGFDAVDDARKAMTAGTMVASVAQFPAEMGRLAVESAVQLIRGQKPPPEHQVRIELVTKANATAERHAERDRPEGEAARRPHRGRPPGARLRARPRVAHPAARRWPRSRTPTPPPRRRSPASGTCRAGTPEPEALLDDKDVDAVVIVEPHPHPPAAGHRVAAARQADLLREAARAHPRARPPRWSGRSTQQRRLLPDGLHAPLRRRLRGGPEAGAGGRDRHAGGLQVHVARPAPHVARVRGPEEQRRHDPRHGHPRLRPRPLVHGRGGRRCTPSAGRSPTPS